MRILLAVLSVLTLLPGITAATDMNAEDLHAFATRYTAAWCSQDAASVAAFFSENGSLKVNDADPAVGRAAITEVAQGFMTAFPDMRLLMDELTIDGDKIEYHWTFIGTNSGPDGTGHAVKFSGYEEWTFGDDGLVLRSSGHFDNDEYQRQLEHGIDSGNM